MIILLRHAKAFVATVLLSGATLCSAADPYAAPVPAAAPVSSPSSAHHRRHRKNKMPDVAPVTGRVPIQTPSSPAPVNTLPDINMSGRADSLGSNSPGGPNMGSSDHIPGTTGTSGQ